MMNRKRSLTVSLSIIMVLALTIPFALLQDNSARVNIVPAPSQVPVNQPVEVEPAFSPTPTPIIKYVILPSAIYPAPTEAPATDNYIYSYPESLGTIDSETLKNLLAEAFYINNTIVNDMASSKYNVTSWMTDRNYSLTSVEQAKNYSAGDSKMPFNVEGHDCDNFAAQLWGYWSQGDTSFVFGYAVSWFHSFNFMVDNNLEIWIVEPMTNEFILYSEILSSNNGVYIPILYIV